MSKHPGYPGESATAPRLWGHVLRAVSLLAVLTVFFGARPCIALDEAPIVIGGIYSLTGAASQSNAFSLKGAQLAVQEINEAGGVLGRPLDLKVFDNLSTPIGSKLAVKRAHEAGAVALLGPSWSSHALTAGKEAQSLKLPMVVDVATNPSVTLAGDHVFRVCFTDAFQGHVLAWFAARELGLKKMAVLVNISSDYSLGLDVLFQTWFKKMGGEIVLRAPYKSMDLQNPEVMDDLVSQLEYLDMDGVFIPGHVESGKIVAAMREAEVMVPAIGGDGWENTTFSFLGDNDGEGTYFCSHWSPKWGNPKTEALVQRYGESVELSAGLALAYDAVYLLADAIRRAGGTESDALRKALARTSGFQGATGVITFDENGDPLKDAVMMRYVKGIPEYLRIVHPEDMQAQQ